MPHTIPNNKGRVRSEEWKRKSSEARKGKHYSSKTEFKKGMIGWNKGKKCPQISQKMKGRKLSPEHREKVIKNLTGVNGKPS